MYPMFGYLNTPAAAKAGAALCKFVSFVSENFAVIFAVYVIMFGLILILTYKSAEISGKVLQKTKRGLCRYDYI